MRTIIKREGLIWGRKKETPTSVIVGRGNYVEILNRYDVMPFDGYEQLGFNSIRTWSDETQDNACCFIRYNHEVK